jgi:hypothetical protein
MDNAGWWSDCGKSEAGNSIGSTEGRENYLTMISFRTALNSFASQFLPRFVSVSELHPQPAQLPQGTVRRFTLATYEAFAETQGSA